MQWNRWKEHLAKIGKGLFSCEGDVGKVEGRIMSFWDWGTMSRYGWIIGGDHMKTLLIILLASLIYTCGGSKKGSSEASSQEDSSEIKDRISYLIPLYSYPTGQYRSEWERLYTLRTNKKVLVIVNVSNGPGESPDPNFEQAINTLKTRGFVVLGYIHTSYGVRDINVIKLEVDRWLNFYLNKIDGFFIDEAHNKMEKYPYYQQIHNYVKSLGKQVVLNPGTNIDPRYFNIADKIVVFENAFSEFLNFSYSHYGTLDPDRVCTIVYAVSSEREAETVKRKALENGSGCTYISEDNTYFKLSPYIH